MNEITRSLHDHYQSKFAEFGATVQGVDWGTKEENLHLRYDKMLEVIKSNDCENKPTFLDAGCGYAGLYDYAVKKGISLAYTGIDVVSSMITQARSQFPEARFECLDILEFKNGEKFDYVVCNGILTQKLSAGILEMEKYSRALIRKMFSLCKTGVAFNIMSSKVNFTVSNLFYKSPVELLSFCLDEITTRVMIDHAYGLYEYTVYLYREDI